MRIQAVVVVFLVALAFSALAASDISSSSSKLSSEFGLSGAWYFPKDHDGIEREFGADTRYIFWPVEHVGVGISLGYLTVQAESSKGSVRIPGYNANVTASGHVNVFPVGPSLYVAPIKNNTISLRVELGARYLFIDSQYEVRTAAVDSRGRYYYDTEKVEYSNGAAGIIGAELDINVSRDMMIFIGGGYMPGISNPSSEFYGVDLGDVEVDAGYVRLGVAFALK